MSRRTKTITFSLPPEMAALVDEIKKDEGRTTSELLREALRRYMHERHLKSSQRHDESHDHRAALSHTAQSVDKGRSKTRGRE